MYPIVFFQTGQTQACDLALIQAGSRNKDPASPIYLLTDVPHKYSPYQSRIVLPSNLKTVDFKEYEDEPMCHLFRQFYPADGQHMSTNPREFEYWCFYRWFLIRSWAKKENVEKFFYADSDVLLYCNIDATSKNFENCMFTTTNRVSCGITFMNDVSVLDTFCQLTLDIFSGRDKFNYNKCLYHFINLQQDGRAGGVNDMSVWEIVAKDAYTNPGLVGETSAIIDGGTFDHNINASDGYMMDGPIKKIKWKSGQPYCYNLWLKKWVSMWCLHHQGVAAKSMMFDHVDEGV